MRKILLALAAFLTATASYGLNQHFSGPAKITLDNPQKIEWHKPTTDADWAEDVKKENFDIKSTSKLHEMRRVHADKLQRVTEIGAKVVECGECVRYELQKANPNAKPTEIELMYQEQLAQYQWHVEKLKQSIERMDAELRLRNEGFVTVEGENKPLFGGNRSPQYVRTIND